ncbi:hypothetical protein M3649_17245 [Ureibacillus chungkukjangi]|uniref:hypothetical protein n=1 Tax=Ureibacillus chungkukjangi TaxID=1202712 RepID=UPI00203B4758|nr:hypothetical protein [Ureibacillus chungkukjangi]MCM3389867.1 hypothetical protein [Ureibacillus chungkukjangi]
MITSRTTTGHLDFEDGSWKTNIYSIYSIPVKTGSGRGAFVTVPDRLKFWRALTNYTLSKETIEKLYQFMKQKMTAFHTDTPYE